MKVEICSQAVATLEKATCGSAANKAAIDEAKKTLAGIVQTAGKIDAADPRQFAVMCGQLLLALERDATKAGCTITIESRDTIVKTLEEWYAQRTAVTPTGDAAADAVIAKIAGVRDATCACEKSACLDEVDKQLSSIGTFADNAPQAARDLGKKLLEDTSRCAAKVRTLTDPK